MMPIKVLDWDSLLERINAGQCTPFLGAGASAGCIKTATAIAKEWAAKWDYPLADSDDLPRVAQFLAIRVDAVRPKDIFSCLCRDAIRPDFNDKNQIHRVLADLPFRLYITTNYDSFMFEALQRAYYRTSTGTLAPKRPKWDYSHWHGSRTHRDGSPEPKVEEPLIYHLHGHWEIPESMVLTEDDYLSFLAWMTRKRGIHPPIIPGALASTSLLFIGYSHRDWTFRVLFRAMAESISRSMRMLSVSVQLPPESTTAAEREKVQRYLEQYYSAQNLIQTVVYWDDASHFAAELRQRWEKRYGALD